MSKAVKSFLNKVRTNKALLVACITALAVLAAAVAYFTFPGQSARDFYFKAESKNFKKLSDDIERMYREFHENREPYLKERYKKRSEITLDISSESENLFGLSNAGGIMDIVGRSKLIIDARHDPAGSQSLAKTSLLIDKTPIIDADVFSKGKELAFSVPVLIPDKYFLVNTDRLDELYERFNISIRPKSILKQDDLVQKLYFDRKELDRIGKEYGKLLSAFIKEENVTYGGDAVVRVGNEERKGRQVFVRLDSETAQRMLSGLLNRAAGDDTLLRLVFGNLSAVSGVLDDSGLFGILDLLGDTFALNDNVKAIFKALNINGDMDELKSKLRNFAEKTEFTESLKMELVIDKNGNILARDVNLTWADSSEKNIINSIVVGTKLDPYSKNGDVKGRIEFTYSKSRDGVREFSFDAGFDIERLNDAAALKKNTRIIYDIKIRDERPDVSDRFHGELDIGSARNNKQRTVNTSTSLMVNMELPTMDIKETSIKLNVVTEDRLGIEEFSIPDTGGAKTVRLDGITDEGLAALREEVMASFGTFYLNNKTLIDALMR